MSVQADLAVALSMSPRQLREAIVAQWVPSEGSDDEVRQWIAAGDDPTARVIALFESIQREREADSEAVRSRAPLRLLPPLER